MRRCAHLMTLLLSVFSPPTLAWEADVHYGLTKWIAVQVGFRPEIAQTLADANQEADVGILDAIHLMFHYACVGKDKKASEEVREQHFPTDGNVGASPKDREVIPGADAAFHLANVVFKNRRTLDIDLRTFGFALHSAQDSWSHQGVPDVPTILGLLRCDPGYAWAHPKSRGGWSEHHADITSHSKYGKAATLATAKATYDLLAKFLSEYEQKHPQLRGSPTVPWDTAFEKDITEFQEAPTKTDKKYWFKKKSGFSNFDFLYGLSIPDGKESFRTISSTWRKGRDAVVRRLARIDIPREVEGFYASFLLDWATKVDARTLVDKHVDANAVAARLGLSNRSESERRDGVAYAFRLWKFADHGQVAAINHRPSTNPGILREQISQLGDNAPLIFYESVNAAYLPRGRGDDGPPYAIFPVNDSDKPAFIAVAKFRHSPYDVVLLTARNDGKNWRIVSLNWMPDH